MPSVSIVLLTCGILVVLLLLLWMLQWKWVNAAWADVVWAFCTAGGGVALALQCDSPPGRRVLVAVLAGCWGLRLGFYMAARLRRHGLTAGMNRWSNGMRIDCNCSTSDSSCCRGWSPRHSPYR